MGNKYAVLFPRKLSSWEEIAVKEISRWLEDESYQNEICNTTMKGEDIGPFTKFLYHFAAKCKAPWGVLIDFNERSQRVFLPDHYYKWMHELRDKIIINQIKQTNEKDTNTTDDLRRV